MKFEFDFLGDHDSSGLERHVPGDRPVLAVDVA
jgi:hypothetical protein